MKITKNRARALEKVDREKNYALLDALVLVKDMAFAKYDESVDLAINLDVDPRHAEENIRITTPLPNGTGKAVTVKELIRKILRKNSFTIWEYHSLKMFL